MKRATSILALCMLVLGALPALRTSAEPAPTALVEAVPSQIADALRAYVSVQHQVRVRSGAYYTQARLEKVVMRLAAQAKSKPLPQNAHPAWRQLANTQLETGRASGWELRLLATADDFVMVASDLLGRQVAVASSGQFYVADGRPELDEYAPLPGVEGFSKYDPPNTRPAGAFDGACGWAGQCANGTPREACWLLGFVNCSWCCYSGGDNCATCGAFAQANGTICFGCPPLID